MLLLPIRYPDCILAGTAFPQAEGQPQNQWSRAHHIADFGTKLPNDEIVFLEPECPVGKGELSFSFMAKYMYMMLSQIV